MDHNSVLNEAMALINERKPEASIEKRAAFASSVVYLVTGYSGGIGGPSVREHAVSHTHGPGGGKTFDKAVELLIADDGLIFGPIRKIHRSCWQIENCFNDDPFDKAELEA